jgi:hypothetical protein
VVNATFRSLYLQERDPVHIVQEAEWTPGSVWAGAENLAPPPTGIRSPDLPARSESLYRLSYPGTLEGLNTTIKIICYISWVSADLRTVYSATLGQDAAPQHCPFLYVYSNDRIVHLCLRKFV